jgi:hypothetical protein
MRSNLARDIEIINNSPDEKLILRELSGIEIEAGRPDLDDPKAGNG